jgi:peroxiredoxin
MRTTSKRTRGAAFLFSILCLSATGGIGVGFAATLLSGAQAPDFVLKSLTGENQRLSEYRGEVVMLSFWASWCSDCREQLIDVNDIYSTHHQSGLQSFTVSMDKNLHDASDMRAELSLAYPVLDDASLTVSRLYDVESLPIVLLIDREGVVREVIRGYGRGSDQKYSEGVEALLKD